MPEVLSFGSLDRPRPTPPKPAPETAFRIAILGNFTGRAAGAPPPLAERPAVKVRHDTLDAVLAKLRPKLRLSAAGEKVELAFASLDDFHPDQIAEQFEPFADLGEDEQNEFMRAVLHHRDFQALESAWRGLEWLLRRADKGGRVEAVLYDVSRDELAADLNAGEDLSRGGLYRLLVEKATQGPKGERWGLLVGHYRFDRTAADARILGRMAKVAAQAGAPFLAGAAPAVHASPDLPAASEAAWNALRDLPEATLLGLALPAFLLRPPYGSDTSSVERFDFEEFERGDAKRPYLWGNPALACAALLAQGFQQQGWAFNPGAALDLTEMPMHVAPDEDGDPTATVGEVWVDRRLAEPLGKQGFMCLLGVKGGDALQLARFQALARPPKEKPFSDLWGPGRGARHGRGSCRLAARAPPPLTAKVGFDVGAKTPGGSPAAASVAAAAARAPEPEAEPEAEAEAPVPTAESAPAAEGEAADADLDALLQELGTARGRQAPAAATPEAAADVGRRRPGCAVERNWEETPTPTSPSRERGRSPQVLPFVAIGCGISG